MARGPRFQMSRSTRGSAARKIFDMKHIFSKLAVIVLATSGATAFAATATGTFQVKIIVNKACTVVTPGADIDFGAVDANVPPQQGASNISVTCSKRTPYFVGLTPSNGNTTGAGIMTAASPVVAPDNTVAYQLRQATGFSAAVWGNTATTTAAGNGVSGQGNGAAQLIPVFATVPSANSVPGTYSDTVTVTVNY